jgi:hypothetical protein
MLVRQDCLIVEIINFFREIDCQNYTGETVVLYKRAQVESECRIKYGEALHGL